MPKPSNIGEVRCFLGMITYYSRFIPNVSTITYPLRKLLLKDSKFKWTSLWENAWLKLKNEILNDRILTLYKPELPLVVTCDASPTGIAGVLSHIIINGVEKPISFASNKSLIPQKGIIANLTTKLLQSCLQSTISLCTCLPENSSW